MIFYIVIGSLIALVAIIFVSTAISTQKDLSKFRGSVYKQSVNVLYDTPLTNKSCADSEEGNNGYPVENISSFSEVNINSALISKECGSNKG